MSDFFLNQFKKKRKKLKRHHVWDFSDGPVAKLNTPNAGGLGSIPSQGTRSHMPQLQVHKLQWRLKIPSDLVKPNIQINLFFFFLKHPVLVMERCPCRQKHLDPYFKWQEWWGWLHVLQPSHGLGHKDQFGQLWLDQEVASAWQGEPHLGSCIWRSLSLNLGSMGGRLPD